MIISDSKDTLALYTSNHSRVGPWQLTDRKSVSCKFVVGEWFMKLSLVRQYSVALCIGFIIIKDIISVKNKKIKKNTLSGVIAVLTFLFWTLVVLTKIISLSPDTQQATQVFDCTSRHTLSLLAIRKQGTKKAKGSKTGWSSFHGSNLWPAVWRPALARNSSW